MQTLMGSEPDAEVEVLLQRLRFVRGFRELVNGELDREEHAVLGLLRAARVPWRQLAEDEYGGVSLNAVAQHYKRLDRRLAGPGA